VSRFHAKIEFKGGQYVLSDLILTCAEDGFSFEVKSIRFCQRESNPQCVSVNRSVLEKVVQAEVALVRCSGSPDTGSEAAVEVAGAAASAFICVPLFQADAVIGVLHVVGQERGDPFTERDMEFAAAVANEMALSIENRRSPGDAPGPERPAPQDPVGIALARYIENLLITRRNAIDGLDHYLNDAGDDGVQDHWRSLYDSLENLGHFTADLLACHDGSSDRGGRIDVNRSIQAGCELFKENLAGAGIALELDLAPDLPEWPLPEPLLQKTLTHLVCNARTALQEKTGGRITISTRMDDRQCLVVGVADNGGALDPPGEKDRPGDGASAACTPGVDLRLSMIRHFAQLSQAGLQVESLPGAGSRISLVWPKLAREAG
jgi:hypothetical protein